MSNNKLLLKLNNNLIIPTSGLGTYLLSPQQAYDSTKYALSIGIRLIDTANAYMNEKAVGRAIKDSGVKRSDIFVSTKLWIHEYTNPKVVEQTLERLGLEYIDLLFLHQAVGDYLTGYKQLEKAYDNGLIKSIGISNFFGKDFDAVIKNAKHLPQVSQIEAHPYYHADQEMKDYDKYGIKLMSWYPLGHADKNLLEEKVLVDLAKKYHKTVAQIILRWHVEMGFIVIPGSKNPAHIKDNFDIYDFELSTEDMKLIDSLHKNKKYHYHDEGMIEFLKNYKIEYEK